MIRFADDITILSESEDGLQEVLNGINNLMSTEYGLKKDLRPALKCMAKKDESNEE